jgi:hypothetical protein
VRAVEAIEPIPFRLLATLFKVKASSQKHR